MHRSHLRAHLRSTRKTRSSRQRARTHSHHRRTTRRTLRHGGSRTHRLKHPRLLSKKTRKGKTAKPASRFKGNFHFARGAPKRF